MKPRTGNLAARSNSDPSVPLVMASKPPQAAGLRTAGETPRPLQARSIAIILLLVLLLGLAHAFAIERFPPPDFTSGHVVPETVVPPADPRSSGWLDVAAVAAGLALASWISLRLRSRAAMVVLALAALAYFGFWRQGCVCAIGSLQNVALGLADPSYPVPLPVLALFALPLVVALIWGRGFCAGVCPHGALQDLLLVKPLKVPRPLDEILRIVPWLYLALAVLLAATGSTFIICKYDPFVPLFRMAGPRQMLLLGAGFLILSLFIGRPYCRYLCPYGALLGLLARVARFRPTVTPDTCTRCRLCESSCPFGALNHSLPEPNAVERRATERRRALALALALPLAAIAFGALGGRIGLAATTIHPTGRLAGLVLLEQAGQLPVPPPDEVIAFQRAGADRTTLFTAAAALETRSRTTGWIVGALLGLALALHAVRLLFPEFSPDYTTDRTRCVSCARCFSACPYELVRRGIPVELPPEEGSNG